MPDNAKELARLKGKMAQKAAREATKAETLAALKAKLIAQRARPIKDALRRQVDAKRLPPLGATADQLDRLINLTTQVLRELASQPPIMVPEPSVVVQESGRDGDIVAELAKLVKQTGETNATLGQLKDAGARPPRTIAIEVTERDGQGNIKTVEVKESQHEL